MTRRILHYDIDAFFTQCAAVEWPDTAGKAELLVVGGSAESRGVVTSASYAARKYGIRAGMATSTAKRLCPQALFVPVPRGTVGEKSRAVVAVIRSRAPVVVPTGVDEGYVDLTGTEKLPGYEDAEAFARRLREAVRDETGMTLSIAVAPNKLVAKVAVDYAKPHKGGDGVIVVVPGEEAAFMERLALGDLPGIGPKFAEKLAHIGLRTVRDVLPLDLQALTTILGADTARWLHDRVRGKDDSPVEERDEVKSTGREETFPRDLHDDAELERELLALCERVGADLRGEQFRARTVTVKIKDGDFTRRQASLTLPRAIESDRAIWEVARPLLHRLRRARRVGARLLGVTLSQLEHASAPQQLGLFDETVVAPDDVVETEKDRRVSQTVDAIRAKFGRDVIKRAGRLDES
ncbi:DNA polymerase IV [Gemmatirosa kalamazoonensis]|uniref:DNA polymerase IV n=1 Tax=Gemmatirosa kalamazoonensis TaxID=861299 RepID=W0RKB3_9BACT|nr:DNA polymerase IV [Gemmatirosa kalamazoonensis]AHG91539.1 DNA polymerase IV [Gemmatirosa kalamazoonensis]